MTEPDECIHGLGPTSACTICNGRDRRTERDRAEQPRIFAAQYAAQCRGCDLPIHPGQIVAWHPDIPGATHEDCWT
jgi:hypothetical protein